MTLPADVSMLADLRRSLTSWLESHGAPPEARDAVVLATHEAVVNAIEHGQAAETTITAAIDTDVVDILVTNSGGPWAATDHVTEERGRGIGLIKGLMTETAIHNDGRKTTAIMRLQL
jgi:anti-sigma regulatory factor (Ser/Thr protein kinase)